MTQLQIKTYIHLYNYVLYCKIKINLWRPKFEWETKVCIVCALSLRINYKNIVKNNKINKTIIWAVYLQSCSVQYFSPITSLKNTAKNFLHELCSPCIYIYMHMYHQDTDYKNTNTLIRNTISYVNFLTSLLYLLNQKHLLREVHQISSFLLFNDKTPLQIYT